MKRLALSVLIALGAAIAGTSVGLAQPAAPTRFAGAARAAVDTLERRFYRAPGRWNACLPAVCGTVERDWGADVLVDALALRWRLAHDRSIPPIMAAVARAAPLYGSCARPACTEWSDIPLWDAVAALRAYQVTGSRLALAKAERAYAQVERSDAYALGACPAIDYQQPGGGASRLKTLETDSNRIKAALLLEAVTGRRRYLDDARVAYRAVRSRFLDPRVPLYSVYVFDDGAACRQLPHRFFASVNGNMIDAGLALTRRTGDPRYRRDALATARAVARYLNDDRGVFADLQAENDVAEPLVEAMYDAATQAHAAFARRWLLVNAAAAQPASSGAYGRFFDGPVPAGPISAWSASGGLALAIAAAALDPAGTRSPDPWAGARDIRVRDSPTAPIRLRGRGIALIGTIGDVCCELGHERVFVDGRETFDRTGIWQNKSAASRPLPNSVLWAWRWRHAGAHTVRFEPGLANAKEGGAYLRLAGYRIIR